jgi:two-component system, NtrC family, response regulator HydG
MHNAFFQKINKPYNMKQRHILLSWIGHDGDFLNSDTNGNLIPNIEGPNITMHRYFESQGYHKHIILYTPDAKSQTRMQTLQSYFEDDNATFKVEFRKIQMQDQEVVDLHILQNKMMVLLLDFKDAIVDILVTTGTKTMHTAWHLVHLQYKDRTKLLQIRPKQYTKDNMPELLTIQFNESDLPQTAIASEHSLSIPTPTGDQIIAKAIKPTYELANKLALADKVPALILGESGTGKELLARHILLHSPRKDKQYRTVNCSAHSTKHLYTALFGQAKGASGSASCGKMGYFEECNGGTLFLDELGVISPALQQSLLRVLQKGEIIPRGANEPKKVDVRVIAATNLNLPEACRTGKFSWDLYYQLAVVELHLPSLVEWSPDDRMVLLEHLVRKKQSELDKATPLQLAKEAQDYILQYPFPGNVREMENLISRFYVVSEGKAIPNDLPGTLRNFNLTSPMSLKSVEKQHIEKVLAFQGDNLEATAKMLGIVRNTLKAKCRKYGIPIKSQA